MLQSNSIKTHHKIHLNWKAQTGLEWLVKDSNWPEMHGSSSFHMHDKTCKQRERSKLNEAQWRSKQIEAKSFDNITNKK